MKFIDFHTHIYPDKIAEKATRSVCNFYQLESDLNATAETLLNIGRESGIDKFVLLPVALKPDSVYHINDFISKKASEHSEFIGFGTLHAGMENPLEEIERIKSLGLHGIKIHPDTQQFSIDDERLYPVYDALQGNIPILIHCGDPRYDYSHPKHLKKILHMFPKLTVIAAHLGGWSMFETAFSYLKDENCYFDISSSMMFLNVAKLKEYIFGYGTDRILFGSDFPLWNPASEKDTFLNLNIPLEDKEKIAYKNAERILNL